MTKQIFWLVFLFITQLAKGVCPYFSIRSQSENAAREIVGAGWNFQINYCNQKNFYGNISITPEYTRSFRPQEIAQSLFGYCATTCNDKYLVGITGSHVANRSSYDWLADYFGLPTDYKGCISFEPRIENILADVTVFLGLDAWLEGLYFKVQTPLVYTRWNLNACETIQNIGTEGYGTGYFNDTLASEGTSTYGIIRNKLTPNFQNYMIGWPTIRSTDVSFLPLNFAKMDIKNRHKTGISDIQMSLGWNCYCDWDYNVGFNMRIAAPTGTRTDAEYLFEPIIGNGHHWEIGAGLNSFWTWWKSQDECKAWTFFLDAHASHLLKTSQCRTFDLCCKPLSRYMLAAKFNTHVTNLKAGDPVGNATTPSTQFAGIYSPVANITTFPVDVDIRLQGEVTCMLQYIHNNWSCDIGYNFWARSCENIEYQCGCDQFEENTWALKGDAFMYGFAEGSLVPVALSASQSQSTIYKGTNNFPGGDRSKTQPIEWYQNSGVDNRKPSWTTKTPIVALNTILPDGEIAQVYTSKNPIFIKMCDIDIGGTKAHSHKFFAHIDHTWCNNHYSPYAGIGFEVEFAQSPCANSCDNSCCYSCNNCELPYISSSCNYCCNDSGCTSCESCALSQWGIWIKCGTAF